MFRKILLSFFILLFFWEFSYAENNIEYSVQKWFNSYLEKNTKNFNNSKKITFLENFSNLLEKFSSEKKLNESQKKLVGDIIKLSNLEIFKLTLDSKEQENKEIIKTNKILDGFKNISYNKNHIFLENGVWYSYIFNGYLTFPEGVKLRDTDLEYNGINKNTTLLYILENGNLAFVKDYKKVKLINDEIIFGIAGKYNFLVELKDDKRNLSYDTDEYFKKLKNQTLTITEGKSKQEKIKIIYNFILENIEYSTSFSTNDFKIFSGIDTYKNNAGVCEGYVKLMLYMLNFAGINNSEVIRGYVIDAEDFPEIGHAWLKIEDKYYDPTFDDPIGAKNTKSYLDYKYFALPYDLFYTNRYTFENIPKILKQKDLEYREELIRRKISPLVSKYKESSYNILKPFIFKLDNNIDINKKLEISDIKNILGLQIVNDFKFKKDNKNYSIKSYKYYILDNNSDIDNLLEQLNFDLDLFYLFYFKDESGKYDFRLAYDVEFR